MTSKILKFALANVCNMHNAQNIDKASIGFIHW